VAKCEAKFTREEEDLLRQEQEVHATDAKCKDLQEFIDRLERSKKEKDVRSAALQADKNELTKEIAALESEIAAADTEISLKTLQKDGLIKEVKEALSDLREMEEVSRENERRRKEMIQRLRDKLENQKKMALDKIDNYKKGLAAIFNSKLHVNQDQQ
jgi:chromosome segregation ATPase